MRAVETRYAVPGWGRGELWMLDGVVLSHEFAFDEGAGASARVSAHPPKGAHAPPSGTVPTESERVGHEIEPEESRAEQLVRRFEAFFAGGSPQLDDVPLDLSWCTPFQHAVAEALRAIPRGEVVSYGELAALAGYPGAARAVGSFCARNRFMLMVPCHRVVAAAGIGGYGSTGVRVKRRLLELEGVRL